MMKKTLLRDGAVTASILLAAFGANLLLLHYFDTPTVTPMIFVLGVFLISLLTVDLSLPISAAISVKLRPIVSARWIRTLSSNVKCFMAGSFPAGYVFIVLKNHGVVTARWRASMASLQNRTSV